MSLDDETLFKKGCNGRTLIEKNYEQHKVAGMMSELYRWLIEGGNKPDFVYTK